MSAGSGPRGPEISIVVVVHDMAREAPRTLHSLSAGYQRDIAAEDYEVIVVDNGSTPPFDPRILDGLAGNFRLIRLTPAPPSPARAINVGLAAARGEVIGVMIDGARIVTPGLLHFARKGARLYPRAIVAALGWYFGFDHQRWAIEGGYNAAREDALLASVGWPDDGYRLFEIGALDGSSSDGWFLPIAESNAMFLSRETWDELGGFDERFDAPGGGFVNLDTFRRAAELPNSELVILLGEGTFHQVHGGVATNAAFEVFPEALAAWRAQYESIHNRPWEPPRATRQTYLGVLPRPALAHFVRGAIDPVRVGPDGPPLGPSFDQSLWSLAPAPQPADPTDAALTALAETEFRARRFEAAAAVARIARARAPDEPAPQRILAHAGAWLPQDKPNTDERRAGFHLARAKAYHLLDDGATAEAEYRAALGFDGDLVAAHVGLAGLRMPGDDYLTWLRRFHVAIRPEVYLEIGVASGHSLALARPPTRAIGVDPKPSINASFSAQTHIFCQTSDDFFSENAWTSLLNRRRLDLAFIDGQHTFAQSLKDFLNVEAHCDARSIVLIHDTLPLDEVTQRPDRQRRFYTGDVWKTVMCLRYYRADLDIFTVATPWSGLTVVTGLDPTSQVFAERYDEAVEHFSAMVFDETDDQRRRGLDIIPNDWDVVEARLKARGVIPTA